MRNGAIVLRRSQAHLLNVRASLHFAIAGSRSYSTQINNGQSRVAVLGGGITGLASAYYLQKYNPRCKITLYESSDRLGGWLSSKRVQVKGGSILFETGPRSLRTVSHGILAAHLIDDLKMKDQVISTPTTSPAANHRYIYYPDHLVRMPHPSFGLWNGLSTIFKEPMFYGLVGGIVREFSAMPLDESVQDMSIGELLSTRFCQPIVDNIVSAIFHGIYAGDVYQLSARSLLPRQFRDAHTIEGILMGMVKSSHLGFEMSTQDLKFFTEIQQEPLDAELKRSLAKTSVFTFTEGIGALTDSLARHLWSSDSIEIRTGTKISAVELAGDGQSMTLKSGDISETYDHVISALSPAHLNGLITERKNHIPEISSVTVMTVNLFYRKAEHLPPGPSPDQLGFGYLIPRGVPFEQNPERALGVVFDNAYSLPRIGSNTEPARAQDHLDQPGTKVTVMLGGHWWDGWPSYPDEQEGLALAKSLLHRHLGIVSEPEAYQVNLNRDCIPQYTVGHEDRLKTAHDKLEQAYKGKLKVAGSWICGVGVNDCLRSAWNVSRSLSRGEQGTGLEHISSKREFVRAKTSTRKD